MERAHTNYVKCLKIKKFKEIYSICIQRNIKTLTMITYLSAFHGRDRCWVIRRDSSSTFKCSVYFTSTESTCKNENYKNVIHVWHVKQEKQINLFKSQFSQVKLAVDVFGCSHWVL